MVTYSFHTENSCKNQHLPTPLPIYRDPQTPVGRGQGLVLTFGFSGTRSSLTSVDIRETDFLGGRAGALSSSAEGFGTDSSPIPTPFTVKSVGRPPEVRVGRGGGIGEALSAGLEAMVLLRFGGRAGDDCPLK